MACLLPDHFSWAALTVSFVVQWLHYLAFKLLHAKRLKPPGASKKPTASTEYTERECYESLVEVEATLGKCIKDLTKRKTKKAAVEIMGGSSLKSAGGVVRFGADKGWLQRDGVR